MLYQFLLYFDKLYDKMTDGEKKEFVKSFVEEVQLYEKEQEDGRFLKHIKFKFPVFFNGDKDEDASQVRVKIRQGRFLPLCTDCAEHFYV